MEFSWNKWRQYIIQEAAVNEVDEFDTIGEITPFFEDAASMGIIKKVDAQRVMDAAGNSEDQDAFESTQEFQQIGREIIMRATEVLEQDGRETHYLYTKFAQQKNNPVEGADIANAVNILSKSGGMSAVGMALPEGEKSLINPEAEEISPEDLEAASDLLSSLAEEDKFDKPGWDLEAIMGAFKEDFEEATRDTDDIVYAQERVIAAYKDVFAKSHPKLSREIDMYLNNKDAETRKMFQNVDDDPEVVGRDMMSEAPMVVDDFEKGDRVALNVAYQKANGNERMIPSEFKFTVVGVREVPKGGGGTYQDVSVERYENGKPIRKSYDNSQLARIEDQEMFGEIEGEVQTEIDTFDEALNDMAIEKAMTATKLDALQNDLEATLSQEEIDTLSDAIVLLRKK